MKKVQKLTLAGLLCAIAVVGSLFSFPMFASRCAPVQHMVNVLAAVFLGPGYAVGIAFTASLLRNVFGLGTVLAFPGSMFGALLASVVFRKTEKIWATCCGEVFGTAILGGLSAYPLALIFFGKQAAGVAFYSYIVPFLISTAVGAFLAGICVYSVLRVESSLVVKEKK